MKGDGKGEDGKTGRSQIWTDYRDLDPSMTCFMWQIQRWNLNHSWCWTHILKGFWNTAAHPPTQTVCRKDGDSKGGKSKDGKDGKDGHLDTFKN